MFLMIDNYDSFVYNLVRYIEELGEVILVKRNDEISIEAIREMAPEGIIISPGPKHPRDAGISLEIVRHLASKIPILGICLGHQVIGYVYGASVIEGKVPVHGKVNQVYHHEQGLYDKISQPFNATRYHSLVIDPSSLPSCLRVTSQTEDGTLMGIGHKVYPVEGVQFHPEAALSDYGHILLGNFVKRCREWK